MLFGIRCQKLVGLTLIAVVLSAVAYTAWSDAIDIFNRGYRSHSEGDYPEALKYYDLAIDRNEIPDDRLSFVYHYKGIALYQLNRYLDAISSYDRAIALNQDIKITYSKRGNALSIVGKFKLAIEDYDRAIEFFPNDPENFNNRGFAWYGLGENLKAIADYDRALELDSKLPNTYFNRSLAWFDIGEYHKTIADCDQALLIKPEDEDVFNTRANAWYRLEKFDNAVRDYDKAISLSPKKAKHYLNRGIVLFHQENISAALSDYDKALELSPGDQEVLLNKSIALKALQISQASETQSEQTSTTSSAAESAEAADSEAGSVPTPAPKPEIVDSAEQKFETTDNQEIKPAEEQEFIFVFEDKLPAADSEYMAEDMAENMAGEVEKPSTQDGAEIIAQDQSSSKVATITPDQTTVNIGADALTPSKKSASDPADPDKLLLDQKIEEYSRQISESPLNVDLYKKRGWHHYYGQHFDLAIKDFDTVIKRIPGDIYRVIGIYIADGHQGGNPEITLQKYMPGGIPARWPGVVLKYFMGTKTPPEVFEEVKQVDGRKQQSRFCEASYYLGEFNLLNKKFNQAQDYFKQALEYCRPRDNERRATQLQLQRLSN